MLPPKHLPGTQQQHSHTAISSNTYTAHGPPAKSTPDCPPAKRHPAPGTTQSQWCAGSSSGHDPHPQCQTDASLPSVVTQAAKQLQCDAAVLHARHAGVLYASRITEHASQSTEEEEREGIRTSKPAERKGRRIFWHPKPLRRSR
jgi:hypothetical protein